jgi:hypothetical protein
MDFVIAEKDSIDQIVACSASKLAKLSGGAEGD